MLAASAAHVIGTTAGASPNANSFQNYVLYWRPAETSKPMTVGGGVKHN